jgi:hypothetical protein
MPVGYAEIESQGFVFSALDHSGQLFVNPVNTEGPDAPEVAGMSHIDDEKAHAVIKALAVVASHVLDRKPSGALGDRERRQLAQHLSQKVSILRAFGEEFSGIERTISDGISDVAHFKHIAVSLAEKHANPYYHEPRSDSLDK